jgi:hypothetical protein
MGQRKMTAEEYSDIQSGVYRKVHTNSGPSRPYTWLECPSCRAILDREKDIVAVGYHSVEGFVDEESSLPAALQGKGGLFCSIGLYCCPNCGLELASQSGE